LECIRILSLKLFKSISLTSIDSYIFSLIFFLLSVIAARELSIEDLGRFSVIMSVYLLHQSIFISCVGEGHVIYNSKELIKPDSLGFSILISILICMIISLLSIPLFLMPLGLSLFEVFIVCMTIIFIILAQNFRYYFLSEDRPIAAARVGLIISCVTALWLFLGPKFQYLDPALRIFTSLGVGAIAAIVYSMPKLDANFSTANSVAFLKIRFGFLKKAGALNFSIWASGNLPWVILGTYLNPSLLGIIRGCLTIINPLQTVERGFTNSLLIQVNASRSSTSILTVILRRYIALIAMVYGVCITLWFWQSEAIIGYTIGLKFIDYSNLISILILIPFFQAVTSFSSAVLKTYSIFGVQILTYLVTPLIMLLIVIINSDATNPRNIIIGMFCIAVFQAFAVSTFLYWAISSKKLTEND